MVLLMQIACDMHSYKIMNPWLITTMMACRGGAEPGCCGGGSKEAGRRCA